MKWPSLVVTSLLLPFVATAGRPARADEPSVLVELRRQIVEARPEVPELLAEVGLTKEALAAHRDAIFALVLPEAFRHAGANGGAPEIPAESEPLLDWEIVAPQLREELLGNGWGSTESRRVRVTFRGDGRELVVESEGLVPWMLPWRVKVGKGSFASEDLAIPRAVLKLVDPKGPCADVIDGSAYWRDGIWKKAVFWDRIVGRDLDAALSTRVYTRLAGWERASQNFTVRTVETGWINLEPESMFFELDAKATAAVDSARWFDHLDGGKPVSSWEDFLAVHERADQCAQNQRWLSEWKSLAPKRQVELQAVGARGIAETMVEELVLPAWKDAGFAGRPEFEFLLREDRNCVGTIYLASAERGALIDSAHTDRIRNADDGTVETIPPVKAGAGSPPRHWFDDLAFSFHPNASPPTYGRVDGDGRFELRTMQRAGGRGR